MRLFAFTREEGSDERNPWPWLLARPGFVVREALLFLAGAGIWGFTMWNARPRAGALSPPLWAAVVVAGLGVLIHVAACWGRCFRTPLFEEMRITPTGMADIAATLEGRGRRWVIFSAGLFALSLLWSLVRLVPMDIERGSPLLVPVHALLFAALGLALAACVYLLQAMGAHLAVASDRMHAGARLGCGCGCGCAFFMGFPSVIGGLITALRPVRLPPGMALAFQGQPAGAGVSGWALLWPCAVWAVALLAIAWGAWAYGRALWRSMGTIPIAALQERAHEERTRKTKWLF